MATIYLSSTYEDLKEHRHVVFEALRKAGHQVIAMENYVAADQRPVNKCLKDVESSEIYVGLFAFRYGYIPPPQHNNPNGFSITELEYRCAETLKKPCLTFIVNDTTAWPRVFDDAYTGGDKGEGIKALRQYLLTEKLASQFSTPHELSSLVLAALATHAQEGQLKSKKIQRIEWPESKSPYPGLFAFDLDYALLFFGRDREVNAVLARMSQAAGRFLIISGASGSGKSSLVGAGIRRAVHEDRLTDGNKVVWLQIQPGRGQTPFESLTWPLSEAFPRISTRPGELAGYLANHTQTISRMLDTNLTPGQELLLFVNQLEELFTTGFTDHDVAHFREALVTTGRETASRSRVIGTVRSEFIARLQETEVVLDAMNGCGRHFLGPISPKTLHEMIEKPAQATGYDFEPKLVDELLR